jgi:hypothetical protein
MQCHDAQAVMTAYLSDEVAPVERREFEAHLAGCAGCRDELTGFRHAWDRLGEWSAPALGAQIERDLLVRLGQEALPASPRLRPLAATVAALAAVLLSVGASLFLPYERAFQLCSEALRGFGLFAGLPDSSLFFIAGAFYGMIPLLLVGLISGRLMGGDAPLFQGTATCLAFALLITPYVLIVCSALPGLFTAAILAGIGLGGLSGGLGGFWLGAHRWRPAH